MKTTFFLLIVSLLLIYACKPTEGLYVEQEFNFTKTFVDTLRTESEDSINLLSVYEADGYDDFKIHSYIRCIESLEQDTIFLGKSSWFTYKNMITKPYYREPDYPRCCYLYPNSLKVLSIKNKRKVLILIMEPNTSSYSFARRIFLFDIINRDSIVSYNLGMPYGFSFDNEITGDNKSLDAISSNKLLLLEYFRGLNTRTVKKTYIIDLEKQTISLKDSFPNPYPGSSY